MLVYFGFLGVSPLEASLTSAHTESKSKRETNAYEAPSDKQNATQQALAHYT